MKGNILPYKGGKWVIWAKDLVLFTCSKKTTKKLVLRIDILYDKPVNINPLSVLENEIVYIRTSSGQIEILTFCFEFRV